MIKKALIAAVTIFIIGCQSGQSNSTNDLNSTSISAGNKEPKLNDGSNSNQYIFVTSPTTVYSYKIKGNSTESIPTDSMQIPSSASSTNTFTLNKAKSLLYLDSFHDEGSLFTGYKIDQTTGKLSNFQVGGGIKNRQIIFDPTGSYAFLTSYPTGSSTLRLTIYTVTSSGLITGPISSTDSTLPLQGITFFQFSPNNQYMYLGAKDQSGKNIIAIFKYSSSPSLSITLVSKITVPADQPTSLAFDAGFKFALLNDINSKQVYIYSVNSDGTLTQIATTPTTLTNPAVKIFSNQNNNFYILTTDSIQLYKVNLANQLTAIGVPVKTNGNSIDLVAESFTSDIPSKIYVLNKPDGAVHGIIQNFLISPVNLQIFLDTIMDTNNVIPIQSATGLGQSNQMIFDQSGNYAYVLNQDNSITEYKLDKNTMNPIPNGVFVITSSNYVTTSNMVIFKDNIYVSLNSNGGYNEIWQYKINANGTIGGAISSTGNLPSNINNILIKSYLDNKGNTQYGLYAFLNNESQGYAYNYYLDSNTGKISSPITKHPTLIPPGIVSVLQDHSGQYILAFYSYYYTYVLKPSQADGSLAIVKSIRHNLTKLDETKLCGNDIYTYSWINGISSIVKLNFDPSQLTITLTDSQPTPYLDSTSSHFSCPISNGLNQYLYFTDPDNFILWQIPIISNKMMAPIPMMEEEFWDQDVEYSQFTGKLYIVSAEKTMNSFSINSSNGFLSGISETADLLNNSVAFNLYFGLN